MLSFILLSCLMLTKVLSHMSLAFPYPRETRDGASFPVWARNEPMYPGQNFPAALCSGLESETSVRSGNVFTVGQTLQIQLYGSAHHLGGHCAFWYSLDESTWYKIVDVIDCTILSAFYVTIPDTIPADCADRCVFAWSWTPRESAACEIYMTCADITVSDATATIGEDPNPVTVNFQTLLDTNNCVRVDDTTHETPIFGDIILGDGSTGSPVEGQTPQPTSDTVPAPTFEGSDNGDCYLNPDEAYNRDAEISNIGQCMGTSGYRCDDGQCCSQWGWCGPADGSSAVDLENYCNSARLGDWRKTICGTTDAPDTTTASGTTDQPDTTSGSGTTVTPDTTDSTLTSGESIYVYVHGGNYWYVGLYIYSGACQTGTLLGSTDIKSVWIACEECSTSTWQATENNGGLWQLNSGQQLEYELSVMIVDHNDVVTEGRYVILDQADSLSTSERCIELESGTVYNYKSSKNSNSSSNNKGNSTVFALSIVAIIALVLIICLLIGFCFWRRNQTNKHVNYENDFQNQQHQPFITTDGGNTSDTPFTKMN